MVEKIGKKIKFLNLEDSEYDAIVGNLARIVKAKWN